MKLATEPIFAALYGLLSALQPSTFTTVSRRLANVQDLAAEAFPAAYQVQGEQVINKKATNVPPVYDLRASWILYAFDSDPSSAPSIGLNALVDACRGALIPSPPSSNQNTLGGLVTQVAIDGTIEIFEGILGDRAVAIIPIHIIAPGF